MVYFLINVCMLVSILTRTSLTQRLTSTNNVFLGKPARQCATFNAYVASKAVDGYIDPILEDQSCTLADPSCDWWMVDLLGIYIIEHVVVYNRQTSYYYYKMNYFIVGLSMNGGDVVRWSYPLCGQYPEKSPSAARMVLYCTPPIPPARYVIVQQSTPVGMISMCEVEGFQIMGTWWTKVKDSYLGGIEVARMQVRSALECMKTCVVEPDCSSVNWNKLPSTSRWKECILYKKGNLINLSYNSTYDYFSVTY